MQRLPSPFLLRFCAVAFLCALAFTGGCAKTDGGDAPSAASEAAPAMVGGAASPGAAKASADGGATAPALPRKIIYTATVALLTNDWQTASAQIVREAKAHGGYIAENQVSGDPNTPREGSWKIRIPLGEFDAYLLALQKMGELQNTSVSSEDVSEEFYDVRARLQNKRVEEARLISLLQKSGKLSDVLLVEKEISRVREEIERMEGRIRFLSSQTDLATITVTLREAAPFQRPDAPPTFASQIGSTFGNSIGALVAFFRYSVLFLVAVLPWVMLPGGLIWYALWRRKQPARKNL